MSEHFVHTWVRGVEIRDFETLNARLGELEFVLREVVQRISAGPVPGAYLPMSTFRSGTVAVGTNLWSFRLPVEFRPVAVVVGCRAGDVTINLLDDGVSIFAAGSLATTSGHVEVRERPYFAVEKVSAGSALSLSITSISGAPADLYVLVIAKAVGKLEQV